MTEGEALSAGRSPCSRCAPDATVSREWAAFLDLHDGSLRDSPFEREFVVRVLAHVDRLRPEDVQPQAEFTDSDGRKRRIDFAIVRRDLRLAIEVDGAEKVRGDPGLVGARLDDAWSRQNDLGAKGWDVLRFTNAQVMSESARCARYITERLRQAERLAGPASVVVNRSPVPVTGETSIQSSSKPQRSRAWLVIAVVAAAAFALIIATNGVQDPSEPQTTTAQSSSSESVSESDQQRLDMAAGARAPLTLYHCPKAFLIKGNYNTRKDTHYYFRPKDGFYASTTPTSCWATAEQAQLGGYTRPLAAEQ